MTRRARALAVLVVLIAWAEVRAGEPSCCAPALPFWQRLQPVGGWCPYGGRLVHWWSRCWFPRGGCPDDYCRKPLPHFGWPPYPPYFKCVKQSCPAAEETACDPQR